MEQEQPPTELREGVRHGILSAIRKDVELRGGRTARLLTLSGIVGVLGALGVILLIARHPFGHHPSWHVLVVSTVWAGILVVVSAIALLGVRTPSLALSRAGIVGMLGLALAGLCGAACPDPHFLNWWSESTIGSWLVEHTGSGISVACFGLSTTFFVATISALMIPGGGTKNSGGASLPASALVLLLLPGVALQSFGASLGAFVAWLSGTAVGAWAGVAVGDWISRAVLGRRRP